MQILSLLYISYCRPKREHPKTWNLLRMAVKTMHKYCGQRMWRWWNPHSSFSPPNYM